MHHRVARKSNIEQDTSITYIHKGRGGVDITMGIRYNKGGIEIRGYTYKLADVSFTSNCQ